MAARLAPTVQVPRIVVNLKAYAEGNGAAGLRLARMAQRVAKSSEPIGWCAPATELASLARPSFSDLRLLAQHIDPLEPGTGTGFLTAEMAAAAGAQGTLLNHAEHKLPPRDLERCVGRAQAAGLWTLVCADSLREARRVAALRPTAVAIEPPELIGGTVSVTSADPGIVAGAVKAVRTVAPRVQVLCGAGVKSGADVAAALALGAHGVLLASGVVKAKDPASVLRDLVAGLG